MHESALNDPDPAPPAPAGVAADAALDSLRARLKPVVGLSPDQGLRIARQRPEFYVRLLSTFIAHHGEDPRHLRAAVQAGELAAVRGIVHALKGVAGNIGATDLQTRAGDLLTALGQGAPDVPGRGLELADRVEALVAALRRALENDDAPALSRRT